MFRTVVLSAIATLMAAMALFAGGASATGYFSRPQAVATVEMPAQEVAGDCVMQARWMSEAGRIVRVERPVCY